MDSHSDDFARYGIDPSDGDAQDRLGAAVFLVEHGVDPDIVRADTSNSRLGYLVWTQIFLGTIDMVTVEQAAGELGRDPAESEALIRSLGLRATDVPSIAADDLAVIGLLDQVKELFGPDNALQVARLLGSSSARLAETLAGLTRVGYEVPLAGTRPYIDLVRQADVLVNTYFPELARITDRILRYHLLALTSQSWGVDLDVKAMTVRGVIGFADIIGFTSQSARLSASGLTNVIDAFEGLVSDAIVHNAGRPVKFIGDEVMFYFQHTDDACACATELLDLAAKDAIPDVRIGMSYGDFLARTGDYYGPVVNVASRLVGIADAGTVLATQEVVERATGFSFESMETRELRGVTEPVAFAKLTS